MNYDLHKAVLRENLVHSVNNKLKKTKSVKFSIICLKAYYGSFMSLILFYLIILIIATAQLLSNHAVWFICMSESQGGYVLDYFHHYLICLMHLFFVNCKRVSCKSWYHLFENQVTI